MGEGEEKGEVEEKDDAGRASEDNLERGCVYFNKSHAGRSDPVLSEGKRAKCVTNEICRILLGGEAHVEYDAAPLV